MSRRHTYIFIFLCLFPFLLAMTFRAADDYRFSQHLEKLKKSKPQYFPKEPPKQVEELMEYKFTCYKKKAMSATDSTATEEIKPKSDLDQH